VVKEEPEQMFSVDRLDASKPYNEENIVFCTWEFNERKGAVTVDDCYKILDIYERENMVAVSDMERLFPTSRQEGGNHYKKHSIQPYTFITKKQFVVFPGKCY
jgi:hypothetical protein